MCSGGSTSDSYSLVKAGSFTLHLCSLSSRLSVVRTCIFQVLFGTTDFTVSPFGCCHPTNRRSPGEENQRLLSQMRVLNSFDTAITRMKRKACNSALASTAIPLLL